MPDLTRLKQDILRECMDDDVGLWTILWQLREEHEVADSAERRRLTLDLVRDLLTSEAVQAGFPSSDGSRFEPWRGSVDEIMGRIETEWDELGREPTIGDIMWFKTT